MRKHLWKTGCSIKFVLRFHSPASILSLGGLLMLDAISDYKRQKKQDLNMTICFIFNVLEYMQKSILSKYFPRIQGRIQVSVKHYDGAFRKIIKELRPLNTPLNMLLGSPTEKLLNPFIFISRTQPAIICSKLTIETLEEGVKYVQSYH